MLELHSKRLRILPLNAENLKNLIDDPKLLAQQLSLTSSDNFLDSALQQALEIRLSKLLGDKENYIWYTNWLIVLKSHNCSIGGIMLKGTPNNKGEVIIGYYTLSDYQGNGYMTETIVVLKDWLLSQAHVKSVVADTEKNNFASHRVLEKAGAVFYKETADLYYWRFI
ncbi:GNAT family N-acetyltransferase [Lysinibacillus sp. NPDC097195]|uniref:GNAT family N-acetyltransferase n=1 Tax=Lysinibacillus sp. NPDC097195 TaxID=3364141 RepID=UPI00380421DD